ncbi:WD domain-containing protein [Histoplasma capsulatum]|uniref:WD domain-containing protein n=2 Tax=Histoplasma TaxID=5036 RepID=A0A8A1MH13_AJECA|nr:WD domain-containing protein [Histoplasma capsulatum]
MPEELAWGVAFRPRASDHQRITSCDGPPMAPMAPVAWFSSWETSCRSHNNLGTIQLGRGRQQYSVRSNLEEKIFSAQKIDYDVLPTTTADINERIDEQVAIPHCICISRTVPNPSPMASPSRYRLLHRKGQSSLSLPDGSYIYSLCQSGIDALAAISSDNSLRRFDRETLKVLPNGVFANIHPGNGGGVTCVCEVDPAVAEGKTLVATSGRDGTVKLWDARDKRRDAVLTATSAKAAPITALTCGPGPCTIVAGTEFVASQSSVICWDIRSPGQPCLQYVESHNDDITELQFHPTRHNVLLSGSTDGLVNIYDTTISDEDEALLQVVNHGSIHRAGFLAEHAIYALSHDEVFSIHPFNNPDENAVEPAAIQFGDLRPVLQSDYVAQVLHGRGAAFVVSGKTSEQRLDLTPLVSSPKFDLDIGGTWRIPDAHGEEIVRSVFLDDNSNTIFTCGEDGYVRSWKIEEGRQEELSKSSTKRTLPENVHTEKHRSKDGAHREKRRKDRGFKPY